MVHAPPRQKRISRTLLDKQSCSESQNWPLDALSEVLYMQCHHLSWYRVSVFWSEFSRPHAVLGEPRFKLWGPISLVFLLRMLRLFSIWHCWNPSRITLTFATMQYSLCGCYQIYGNLNMLLVRNSFSFWILAGPLISEIFRGLCARANGPIVRLSTLASWHGLSSRAIFIADQLWIFHLIH